MICTARLQGFLHTDLSSLQRLFPYGMGLLAENCPTTSGGRPVEELGGLQPLCHLPHPVDVQVPASQHVVPMETKCGKMCSHGNQQLRVEVRDNPTLWRQVGMYVLLEMTTIMIVRRCVPKYRNRIVSGAMCVGLDRTLETCGCASGNYRGLLGFGFVVRPRRR